MTDNQSDSLFWNKVPTWNFYCCQTVEGLLMWGALSDDRTGLSFTITCGLVSTVILRSEFRGTHDHILLSQIRDFPFCCLLWLAGLWWKYSTPPPHRISLFLSPSLMLWPMVSLPVSPRIKHPSGAYDQIFITVRQSQVCWCGALSLMTGLSFTTAVGLRQHSHSWVRVPWDSWPYFTGSHLRLPFSSPSITGRATVEVFDTACTHDFISVLTSFVLLIIPWHRLHRKLHSCCCSTVAY
jgi:hypothetical protein